jgi:hypothetical protein
MDDRGSIPGRGNEEIFLFATASRPAPGPTQPPINEYERGSFLVDKVAEP